MRVLRFLPSGVYGGPHNEVKEMNASLTARGVTQQVVIPDESGDAAGRLRAAGVNVTVRNTWRPRRTRSLSFWMGAPLRAARDVWLTRALVREGRIDVVVGSGGGIQIALGA